MNCNETHYYDTGYFDTIVILDDTPCFEREPNLIYNCIVIDMIKT